AKLLKLHFGSDEKWSVREAVGFPRPRPPSRIAATDARDPEGIPPRACGRNQRTASGSEAMFFRKKQSLVGLDIGSSSVKVVEIETLPSGGHRLVNYGISEPLSEAIVDGEIMDRQLVTDAIANLLESRGVKTRNVVAAVSGRAVIVKKI